MSRAARRPRGFSASTARLSPIPCFKYYDLDGGAGKVINGFSGYGAGLYVPASRREEAEEILQAEPVTDDNE